MASAVFEDPHRARRADTVAMQKDHNFPDRFLLGPGSENADSANWSDAVDFTQPVRCRLDDVEHLVANGAHQFLGVNRANASDHAGREIFFDAVGGIAPTSVLDNSPASRARRAMASNQASEVSVEPFLHSSFLANLGGILCPSDWIVDLPSQSGRVLCRVAQEIGVVVTALCEHASGGAREFCGPGQQPESFEWSRLDAASNQAPKPCLGQVCRQLTYCSTALRASRSGLIAAISSGRPSINSSARTAKTLNLARPITRFLRRPRTWFSRSRLILISIARLATSALTEWLSISWTSKSAGSIDSAGTSSQPPAPGQQPGLRECPPETQVRREGTACRYFHNERAMRVEAQARPRPCRC
jgi:hypothetical protein